MEHNDLHLFLAGSLELASVLGERDQEVVEFVIKLTNVNGSLSFMMALRITSSDVEVSSSTAFSAMSSFSNRASSVHYRLLGTLPTSSYSAGILRKLGEGLCFLSWTLAYAIECTMAANGRLSTLSKPGVFAADSARAGVSGFWQISHTTWL